MKKAFKLKVNKDGIARLTFNLQGEKVNKFSSSVMEELNLMLQDLNDRDDIKIMTLESAKENIFIAGADIHELDVITDKKEAQQKAEAGQKVFTRLSELPFPTVAVINGACLGGGLECAMACTYRIVSDNPKALMGCSEVQLGILPAWGGTQRLPRLTGLLTSLPMLLTGKSVKGAKAVKIKLADVLAPVEFLDEKVSEFVDLCLTEEGSRRTIARRRRKGISKSLLEDNPLGRAFVFHKAKVDIREKTGGHYPAVLKIVEVLQQTSGKPLNFGMDVEAEAFAELSPTRESKNLISLFFTNEALKKDTGVAGGVIATDIESAGIIGAGVMGGGISWLFSSKGFHVRMKDINWDAISKGCSEASVYYKQMLKRHKITRSEMSLKMHYITGTLDFSGFQDKDVVVEAVVEKMDIKKKVLTELEENIGKKTIICSNTSALSITDMAKALKHPERFIGMHFFNPVNRMPLVEVIPGAKTSEQTIASTISLVKKLGKTPVLVQNCAGFLVNRLLLPYMNEAVLMAQEGADIQVIDTAMKDYGMPMGPFTLADEVGIDICWKVTGLLAETYKPRMRMTELLELMHNQDHLLGRKGGRGFYIHKSGKKKGINPAVQEHADEMVKWTEIKSADLSNAKIVDRCIFIMINEASRCLEEGVVEKASYLDMALILGTGFPPFRGGLLRYADERGICEVVDRLQKMADKYGERYEPSPMLLKMSESGENFYNTEA